MKVRASGDWLDEDLIDSSGNFQCTQSYWYLPANKKAASKSCTHFHFHWLFRAQDLNIRSILPFQSQAALSLIPFHAVTMLCLQVAEIVLVAPAKKTLQTLTAWMVRKISGLNVLMADFFHTFVLLPALSFSSNSPSPSGTYSFDIFLERNHIFFNLHFAELKQVQLFLVTLHSSLPNDHLSFSLTCCRKKPNNNPISEF